MGQKVLGSEESLNAHAPVYEIMSGVSWKIILEMSILRGASEWQIFTTGRGNTGFRGSGLSR